jgi:Ni,Fe-hydrogenase III component G
VVLAASIFIDPVKTSPNKGSVVEDNKTQWEQIENAAQAELLAAAVEHMDEFSDQDLITMIGF